MQRARAGAERFIDPRPQLTQIVRREAVGVELFGVGPHAGRSWATLSATNTQSPR